MPEPTEPPEPVDATAAGLADDPAEDRVGSRGGGGVRPALVAVLVVLLVAAVAVAGLQWRRASDARSTTSARNAVATAAGAFGEALLSYDYHDLFAARDRVTKLSTAHFAEQYTTSFFMPTSAQITSLQGVATASVNHVYVADVEDKAARAVVSVDSEIRLSTSTQRRLGQFLELSMVREGSDWKVDEVTFLGRLDQQTTGAQSPETTTTTAPTASGG